MPGGGPSGQLNLPSPREDKNPLRLPVEGILRLYCSFMGCSTFHPMTETSDPKTLSIAYLGNYVRPFCTEQHLASSFESLGCRVTRIQEGRTSAREVPDLARAVDADVLLWTQTYDLAEQGGSIDERQRMILELEQAGIPTIGFHLDRWWGLDRELQIWQEPFFSCKHLFTADGGNDDKWHSAGINHHWLPPAVYHEEAYDGTFNHAFESDVIFVGSWRHYAHKEHWLVRKAMLDALREHYGPRFRCYPEHAQAVRGRQLNSLYASCKLVVGDSCTTGSEKLYWSDRIPETTGRGGLLIHPEVLGLSQVHPGLPTFPQGDWDSMLRLSDALLEEDKNRIYLRERNSNHTRTYHTYKVRALQVLQTVGLLVPA